MKTKKDKLRKEYPEELIRSGVRGKHAKRFRDGRRHAADLQLVVLPLGDPAG